MNPVSKFTPKYRREKTNSDQSDESKEPVSVFCRLCPLRDDIETVCFRLLSPTTLVLTSPPATRAARKEVHCRFKHIFTGHSTQSELFERVARPLLDDLLRGKNALLFTYGVTGSGKTYTLTGAQEAPGVIPRCVNTVFNSIADRQAPKFTIKSDRMNGFEVQGKEDALRDQLADLRAPRTPAKSKARPYSNDGALIADIDQSALYAVFVSYVEIYNNSVYDLLDEAGGLGRPPPSKILREDASKGMYVNGVVEVEVKSAEEAFQVFNFGRGRKKMANTLLNSVSSRSHSIFNLRVVQFQQVATNANGQATIPSCNQLKVGRLSLVDLAGSERTNRTQNTGALLKEASQINNSLMSLRACLEILRENQTSGSNRLVPYRDSRLTLLFRNYFEGDGRIAMIVCVNPSIDDFEENLQVMKFAEVTQDVKVSKSESRYCTPIRKTIQKKVATSQRHNVSHSFNFGPKIPEIELRFVNMQEAALAFEKLENVLRKRINCMQTTVERDLRTREARLRKRLVDMQQENVLNAVEVKSGRVLLKKEKAKVGQLEAKLGEGEQTHYLLEKTNADLRTKIKELSRTIEEKDFKISKKVLENERTKQKMRIEGEKKDHELDEKLRRQREHLKAEMKSKDVKLQRMRDFLEKEVTPPLIEPETTPLKEIQVMQTPSKSVPASGGTRRGVTPASRHRRSKSAGDRWLEHNAIRPIPLGTVLQPTMKKRKSVTKLAKASDVTNPKQSKYCLIAQEQATDGEVETKLYKGDIVATCGGGAQVIFNDVERLRQESPSK